MVGTPSIVITSKYLVFTKCNLMEITVFSTYQASSGNDLLHTDNIMLCGLRIKLADVWVV